MTHGNQKNPTDPRARQYLTTQQTTAAITWIKQQSPETPWMATLSYSAAHLPVQQPPKALLPLDAMDSSPFDCTNLVAVPHPVHPDDRSDGSGDWPCAR